MKTILIGLSVCHNEVNDAILFQRVDELVEKLRPAGFDVTERWASTPESLTVLTSDGEVNVLEYADAVEAIDEVEAVVSGMELDGGLLADSDFGGEYEIATYEAPAMGILRQGSGGAPEAMTDSLEGDGDPVIDAAVEVGVDAFQQLQSGD